jgi:PKD repeat protein
MKGARFLKASLTLAIVLSAVLPAIVGGPGTREGVTRMTVALDTVQHSPPVAVATADPTTIVVGNRVTFDASASTDEWYITSWAWHYLIGNETVSVLGMRMTQLFNVTGTYVVWLTVHNCWGLSNTTSVTITVLPPSGPNDPPIAEAGLDFQYAVDSQLSFDGSQSQDDIGIIDYLWTFDDCGTPVRLWGCNPSYTFHTAGDYTVNLTVTDSCGLNASDEVTVHILVIPWPGVAEAGPNQTVAVGEVVTFNGSASASYFTIGSYEWMLMDGLPITLSGMVVNYTFSKTGTYVVVLTIRDEWTNLIASDMVTVFVTAPGGKLPMADAGTDANISSGTLFEFNGTGSVGDIPNMSYLWKFHYNGSWEVLFGQEPTFLFAIPGRYVVTLTVTDTEMRSDNDTVTITVLKNKASGNSIPDYVIWLVLGSAEAVLVTLALLVKFRWS